MRRHSYARERTQYGFKSVGKRHRFRRIRKQRCPEYQHRKTCGYEHCLSQAFLRYSKESKLPYYRSLIKEDIYAECKYKYEHYRLHAAHDEPERHARCCYQACEAQHYKAESYEVLYKKKEHQTCECSCYFNTRIQSVYD